jgi:fumarate hydratase class II
LESRKEVTQKAQKHEKTLARFRACMLTDDLDRIRDALTSVYRLALDGTAVGRINAAPGFAEAAASEIATLTGLPFVTVHRQRPRW